MSRSTEKTWPQIIKEVTSFYSVCALVLLVVGAAFSAMALARKVDSLGFFGLLAFLVLLLLGCLHHSLYESKLTFRVRISKSVGDTLQPWEGVEVKLVKNGRLVDTKQTGEQGEVMFSESLKRRDELEIRVTGDGGSTKTAALYAEGQVQVVKSIVLA
jgi:hypothetical protein